MEAFILSLIAFFSSEAGLTVIGALLTFVVGLIGRDRLRKWKVNKIVTVGVPIAYHVVNEIARRTPNKIDDKIAEGLRVLKEYLKTEGVKDSEVTEEHLAKARLLFDALHAQEKEARERNTPTVIVTEAIIPDVPPHERN